MLRSDSAAISAESHRDGECFFKICNWLIDCFFFFFLECVDTTPSGAMTFAGKIQWSGCQVRVFLLCVVDRQWLISNFNSLQIVVCI
jgi:hypothetical protein